MNNPYRTPRNQSIEEIALEEVELKYKSSNLNDQTDVVVRAAEIPLEALQLAARDVEKQKAAKPPQFDFPDGGFEAWKTVVGAWLTLFCTFGFVNSFGVFQDYYSRVWLSNNTPADISWIGSVQIFLMFASGMIVGKLFDDGYFHHMMITGSTLYVVCLFMLSLVKEHHFYQVFLSHGLGIGISMGIVFLPAVSINTHHFLKKRGLVIGICFSGSSVGGIVFPIMLNKLINGPLGFAKGVRALAFLIMGVLIIANLLMRTRLPPRKENVPLPTFMDLMKDGAFVVFIISQFLLFLGVFFPFFYLQLDAIKHNINPNLAFYAITALNAASVPGRILPNFYADKVGYFNVMIVSVTCSGGIVLAMLGLRTPASVLVIAILFGFVSGTSISLIGAMVHSLAKTPYEIGIRTGIAFLFMGIAALVGTPINGALLSSHFDWWKAILWSAITIFLAGFFVFWTRQLVAARRGSHLV